MNIELVLFLIGGFTSAIGAGTVALPDVPRLRLILWSERVREGIYELESNGLTKEKVGFEEVGEFLQEIYETDMPLNSWGYRVGFHTMSRYGFESVYLFTDPSDENVQIALGKGVGKELDYRTARTRIKHRINNYQAAVRGGGFLLISFGFVFQAISQVI